MWYHRALMNYEIARRSECQQSVIDLRIWLLRNANVYFTKKSLPLICLSFQLNWSEERRFRHLTHKQKHFHIEKTSCNDNLKDRQSIEYFLPLQMTNYSSCFPSASLWQSLNFILLFYFLFSSSSFFSLSSLSLSLSLCPYRLHSPAHGP